MDVFSKISRKTKGSTQDLDIIPKETIVSNGLLESVIRNSNINKICCVYKLAYETLLNELYSNNDHIIKEEDDDMAANKKKIIITVFNKNIEVILLYPATRSMHKGHLKDEQYKYFLFS